MFYTKLCQIIEFLYDNYSNHIGKIENESNGTVRLKQSISDYAENVQYKQDKIQYFYMTMERNPKLMKKQCLEYILGKMDGGYLDFCRYCGADNRSLVEAGCKMER